MSAKIFILAKLKKTSKTKSFPHPFQPSPSNPPTNQPTNQPTNPTQPTNQPTQPSAGWNPTPTNQPSNRIQRSIAADPPADAWQLHRPNPLLQVVLPTLSTLGNPGVGFPSKIGVRWMDGTVGWAGDGSKIGGSWRCKYFQIGQYDRNADSL